MENSSIKDEEFDKVHWSLVVATMDKHVVYLNDENDKFIGFLTWEIRQSDEKYKEIDLGITNLVISKKFRGIYPLHRITTFLRNQYPNIHKFIWMNRKKKRMFEAKQKEKLCLNTL